MLNNCIAYFSAPKSKLKVALVILLLLIIGLVEFSMVYRAAWGPIDRTDYTVFKVAGQALLDGSSIYDAKNSRGWYYVYPPPFAILMVPFAKMSVALGALIWYLLEVASLYFAAKMAFSLIKPLTLSPINKNRHFFLFALSIGLALPVMVTGAMRGQTSAFVILLIVASFYFCARQRHLLSGTTLAAAVLIKVTPITLLIYFIVKRQWKVLQATVFAMIILGVALPSTVIGWNATKQLYGEWVEVVIKPAMHTNEAATRSSKLYDELRIEKSRNQSLQSLMVTVGMPSKAAGLSARLVGIIMLLSMLWLSIKPLNAKGDLALMAAYVVWYLVIPPISQNHYFGIMFFPIAVILFSLHNYNTKKAFNALIAFAIIAITAIILASFKQISLLRPMTLFNLLMWLTLTIIIKRSKASVT